MTNALGTSEQQVSLYRYDVEGNLTNVTDNLLRQIDYQHDDLNRQVRAIFFPIGASIAGTGLNNRYGPLGCQVAVTNAFCTAEQVVTRTVYDFEGRVALSIDGRGVQ